MSQEEYYPANEALLTSTNKWILKMNVTFGLEY